MAPSIMSSAHTVFTDVERQGEKVLAWLRVLVLLVLAAVFWWSGAIDREHTLMFSIGGYGLLTASSLVLAVAGIFRPWLPWLLTTLDVALLIHCLFMFTVVMAMPLYAALGVPGASMIFLFLASGAMRYRPYLVLYTGLLFVAGWGIMWLVAEGGSQGLPAEATHMMPMELGLVGELARLAVVALTALALFMAVKRTRALLVSSIEEMRLRANLARYFPPRLVDELAGKGETTLAGQVQKAAVLFADIRGFTAMAESMTAPELASLLNDYRRRMAKPVADHEGVVDKFIGDGIMVVFGAPIPSPNDARNALDCARAMLSAMSDWNRERRSVGQPPIQVGIGIHYGDVVSGALGDESRLEYTVIGDTVNVADRIEKLTTAVGADLLVSEDLLFAAREIDRVESWEPLTENPLMDRRSPIKLYKPVSTREAPSSARHRGFEPRIAEDRPG